MERREKEVEYVRRICAFGTDLPSHQIEVRLDLGVSVLEAGHDELKVIICAFGSHV